MVSEDAGKNLCSFGVGCFHFQALTDLSGEDGPKRYFEHLKEFLHRDNLVKDVEIIDAENEVVFGGLPDQDLGDGSFTDVRYVYPYLQKASIRFTIAMPPRIQKEYLSEFRSPLVSENFEVHVAYGHQSPVAYVKPEHVESDPSKAVAMLWKYMKKNWSSDGKIQFFMLGPSPFHADFFVAKKDIDNAEIRYKEQFGYDEVLIEIPKKISDEFSFDLAIYRLTSELSIFYRTVKMSNKINRRFELISNEIDANLDQEILNSKKKIRVNSGIDAYASLIRLEKIDSDIQSLGHAVRGYQSRVVQQFGDLALEKKILEVLGELKKTPIQSYKNIVSTLKERNSTHSANKTAIISAFIGVVLGFLLQQGTEILSEPKTSSVLSADQDTK